MQLLITTLLVLNFIGVLFLTIRSFRQPKNDFGMEQIQKIIENQMALYREVAELKGSIEHYHATQQKETEQRKEASLALETSIKELVKPKPRSKAKKSKQEQNLLLTDRYQEIFELQKQGLTADEIAKKLDKGCGEVTLILDLAKQA